MNEPTSPAPYPRLVADIGGTNARFAIIESPGAAPTHLRSMRCADHAGPAEALQAWQADTGAAPPQVAAFGIATPLTGDQVAMTNHRWQFSIGALRAACIGSPWSMISPPSPSPCPCSALTICARSVPARRRLERPAG
jgi:glucokinase